MVHDNLNLPPEWDGNIFKRSGSGAMKAPHTHDELELNLVVSGKGKYIVEGKSCELRSGSILWLYPLEDHILVDYDEAFVMWILVFKQQLVARVASHLKVLTVQQPERVCLRQFSKEQTRKMALFFEYCESIKGKVDCFNSWLGTLLLDAYRQYERSTDIPPPQELHPAVENAALILQQKPEISNFEDLAYEAGLSRSQLSRLFHQQTGIPLVHFRNRCRIEKFLSIYESGQRMNLLDAALDSGFGSYPQFHRVFTSIMGCSPASYRKKLEI